MVWQRLVPPKSAIADGLGSHFDLKYSQEINWVLWCVKWVMACGLMFFIKIRSRLFRLVSLVVKAALLAASDAVQNILSLC